MIKHVRKKIGELPSGWKLSSLGEFVARRSGSIVPKKTPNDVFELYSVPSHANGMPEIKMGKEIGSNKQLVQEGTVLLCKINPRINRSWVVTARTPHKKIASTEWITFPLNDEFDPKYLEYYLKQDLIRDFLSANASGVGGSLMRVRPATIQAFPFPLAPKEDQQKIVAEIEKQFSRLDEAVTSLKRAKANLKRYKAALLKAAVEGKLTEEWRKQNPAVESAAELLKSILVERRRKWDEAEHAKRYVKATTINPMKRKSQLGEPKYFETNNYSKLPTTWIWTSLDQIIVWGPQNGLYLHKSAYRAGISILRIDDFQDGVSRRLADLQQVFTTIDNIDKFGLHENDLIINRVNSPSHLGKCLVVAKRSLPSLFESNMMRLKLSRYVSVRFVALYLQSRPGKASLVHNAKWAVNQASINQHDVVSTKMPLPPLQEQEQIVSEVESLLSQTAELKESVDKAIKRVLSLRQSVLRKSFSGNII